MNIPVADIYANVLTNPSCIINVPIADIERLLTERTDLYEITWKNTDDEMCRAYIDIDGTMDIDTDEADFDTMDEAIKYALNNADFGTPFSIMTASKYRNKDWKDKTIKHKLSYRLTFTNKCGSKEAVKCWTRDVLAPKIKEELKSIIPFYIKGVDSIPADATDYLDWDNGVYRSHGKMRCWNSTKPNEGRKNVLIKGKFIDTLINYVPEDCEVIPPPVVASTRARLTVPVETPVQPNTIITAPVAELTPEKKLIVRVVQALPVSLANDYLSWVNVGMACFNEDIPMNIWDEWSSISPKYKAGECAKKWKTFKKSNITQASLWSLLKKEDPIKFKELIGERKDFQRLIENPTHYSVAEYFYNNRPNDYLYDTNSGWFGVMPTNIWENPKGKSYPPTLKNKLVRVLNAERLQLEGIIIKKKQEAMTCDDSVLLSQLDKISEKCITFKNQIESEGFQKGVISFLSSFYAEQSQMLMLARSVKDTDGVLAIFDTNPDIFAFTDCLYDFKLKDYRPIEPTDYITLTCGYPRPTSNSVIREKIMETLTGIWEDEAPRDYMLTLLASCLCGTRNMEVFSILTGRGGNGKGLIWELVMNTFGGYYYQLPKQSLTKNIDSATAATPDIANLRGMRCVGTSEPEAEEKLQEGTVKLLTGGDPLTGRPLYGQPFTFKPQFGLFIQCNTIPMFNQITKGGVRRNRVIPFPFNFVGEPKLSYERKGDPYIKNNLCKSEEWRNEFFCILHDYFPKAEGKQIDAIHTPKLIREATDGYVEDNNRVGVWWAENYEVCENAFVLSRDALEAYKEDIKTKIGEREFKSALAFNDIDIKKISRGEFKGRMGIEGWKRIVKPEDDGDRSE